MSAKAGIDAELREVRQEINRLERRQKQLQRAKEMLGEEAGRKLAPHGQNWERAEAFLRALDAGETLTAEALHERVGVARGSAAGLLRRAEEAGLVRTVAEKARPRRWVATGKRETVVEPGKGTRPGRRHSSNGSAAAGQKEEAKA